MSAAFADASVQLAGRARSVAENILIVTEDEELLDDLLRLCAAAGTEPQVAHGGPAGGAGWASWSGAASWERAPLVLVGDDCAGASGFGA
ncbi:hypothetical protein AN220_24330, partial [Streptomyces nanshensis]